MLFRVLGVLEIRTREGWTGISASKWRALLAALLLRHDQVVSTERLIDELWGDDPPPGAYKLVSGYVSRLRRVIGDPGGLVLVTRSPGYQLMVSRDDLDVSRFEDLVAAGRKGLHDGDPERGAELLAEALGLWRGPALADVLPGPIASAESDRLDEMRLGALELRIDADLACGRGSEVLAELRRLTAEHPLRERLWAELMRALHGHGQSAEALGVYSQARQIIAAELGAHPGPDLQDLHRRILVGDPTLTARPPAGREPADGRRAPLIPATLPRQLPAVARHFVGREKELDRLSGMLDEVAGAERAAVISAIIGSAGVGKTALAVHWSHRVAQRFPDGQLYVNLRGFDPSGAPLAPAEAIRHFLDGLGVPPERIPARPQAQAGLFRSLLADKRMLVVLDNARDDAQVRPLLPGSHGCMALITSRSQLAGLAATDGAHLLTLDVLTSSDARGLLARRLGPERITGEPEAVTELTRLCARLPLALSIAAARAAARPSLRLAALASELRDSPARLDELDTGDASASVRAVFSWSCQQLSGPAARMFRLHGVHPGPDITAPAAASMAGVPLPEGREALRDLARAHLVSEHLPGRYTCHDLLHAYAAEQARAHCSAAGLWAARSRLRDHYLHTARAASAILYPARQPLQLRPPEPGVTPERLASHAEAQAWFRAEHQTLLAVIAQSARADAGPQAWQLPVVLADFLNRHGHWHDLAATQDAALAAAREFGDQAGEAHAHHGLGTASLRFVSSEKADMHLRVALGLFQQLGHRADEAHTHLSLAAVSQQRGQHGEALRHTDQALSLYRESGLQAGAAHAMSNVGWYHAWLGDYPQALSTAEQALRMNRDVGNPLLEAHTWDHLGFALHHLSRHADAIGCYERALGLLQEVSDRYEQAGILTRLGDTHQARSDGGAARQAWQQALAILDDLQHPDAEQIFARLRFLGTAGT
jgi:DNA-binding SARP family transcriptional activator/Tfp pilus assembly protein PilF